MTEAILPAVAAIGRIEAVPKILDVVCQTTGMGFAVVARVTGERWIACAVRDSVGFGLQPGGELRVETTICQEIRQSYEPVVINHVAEDPAYCGHPTPSMYGFQSYISVPITFADGTFFGTLCALDPHPAKLDTPEIIGMFKLFAELIAVHLEAGDRLAASEASLLSERESSTLREQFIAVLGHDLRNPLASLSAGIRLLAKDAFSERDIQVLELMRGSVARMSGLIDNVLDFARGRLGGGITMERKTGIALEPILQQVVEETRISAPDRIIDAQLSVTEPVNCDPSRLGQMVSNLLGNAVTHGAVDESIRMHAATDGAELRLWVANGGPPIPTATLDRLFQPFFRGERRQGQHGLGLGLHIASEIAKAHGGQIEVLSTPAETRFTFRMPLNT